MASVRDRAANRLWQELARQPTAAQRFLLEDLLKTPEGSQQSRLDRLRRAPTHVSGPGLIKALRRLTEIRAIGVTDIDLSFVPTGRLKQLARYAAASRVTQIERMPDDRRIATLLAWACVFVATAQDEAFDLLDGLMRSFKTLAALQTELHTAYHQTRANFATNTAIRMEQKEGQDHLILTPLDRLEEPKSLLTLRG